MKVLVEKPFLYNYTCKSCGSELEAEALDVTMGEFGGYDDRTYEPYLVCPVCDTVKILNYSELTPKVLNGAKERDTRR